MRIQKTAHKKEGSEELGDPSLTEQARPPATVWREAVVTAGLLIAAVLVALFLKAYVIQPYVVDGQSMETTLNNGDRLLVDKLPLTIAKIDGHAYVPHRGDIIIFNEPGLPGYSGTKQLIKRVIGLPGERVTVKDGKITVYNTSQPGGFNPDTSVGYHISAASTPGSVDLTLGTHQLFVCGDNRPNSEDSRYFGPINTNQIVGKLWLRILPISKAHGF